MHSNHSWRLQGQSICYIMLHMEVPNESKLFALIGLDINHFLLLWIYFIEIQPFDQTFGGGGFGDV